jgi:hypothetical protein
MARILTAVELKRAQDESVSTENFEQISLKSATKIASPR